MASHYIRREGKSSNAEPLRFFRIIENPQDTRLQLPKDFVTQCGHSLPSRITLKVRNGIPWEIDLIRSDGDTWMNKGWEEFRDYHSMESGHMLMFKYDWISNFSVRIFDSTGLEIKYQEGLEIDDAIVFVKEKKGIEISDSRLARRVKRRNGPKNEDFIEEKNSSRAIEISTFNNGSFQDNQSDGEGTSRKVSKTKSECDKKSRAAYERAETFKSDNPFCIIQMHQSYVFRPFNLNLPVAFARKNLPQEDIKLKLSVSDGKTWTVVCNFRNAISAKISGGWTNFVKGNKLQVGDVCVFEAKNREKLEWNVIIFRC